jgi:hypothetical protein
MSPIIPSRRKKIPVIREKYCPAFIANSTVVTASMFRGSGLQNA